MKKQKVILITIDCLRQDHLELYGYNRNLTPNIDKLAKSSIIFNNAIVNGSNTPSSFYSLFTSKIPTTEGSYAPIPLNKIIFTEILQKNKIQTCGIHSNPHLGSFCNYNRGFDYFIDVFENPQFSVTKSLIRKITKILIRFKLDTYIRKLIAFFFKFINLKTRFAFYKTSKSNAPYSEAKTIIIEAFKWLKKNFKSEFFMWIHFMDVHRPYYPPEDFINRLSNFKITDSLKLYLNDLFSIYKRNPDFYKSITEEHVKALNILYDAEIMYVDHYLGIFFTYLKKLGVFDSLNIIISSDHGQALFDHNQLSHGVSLYDELLKVPLIMKLENSSKKEIRRSELVEWIDIAPTILDLFNVSKPKQFSGVSLLPLIKDDQDYKHKNFIISAIYHGKGKMFSAYSKSNEIFYPLISYRDLNWKLIFDEFSKKIELYNLNTDKQELNNLTDSTREQIILVKDKIMDLIKPYIKEFETEKVKIKLSINKDLLKLL